MQEKIENQIENRFNIFKRAYYIKPSLEIKKSFEDKVISEIDFSRLNETEFSNLFQRIKQSSLEKVILIFSILFYSFIRKKCDCF